MRKIKTIGTCFSVLLILSSCGKAPIEDLNRTELFSLGLGKMEDQMALFQRSDAPFKARNYINLKDGRIYISDANSSKIMEFTTYGDLISLIYNSKVNPEPVILSTDSGEDDITNRWAQSYPFLNIGHIVVDSKKRLYVEDEVLPEQSEVDKDLDTVYYKQILLFDRQGNYLDYIGQEGWGGTPFPFIESIHITDTDELVVVCRLVRSRWIIFWFDNEGYPRYRVEIHPDNLPKMKDAMPFLNKVFPAFNEHTLYLMLTYYSEEISEATGSQESIQDLSTRIYSLDLAKGIYRSFFKVPDSGTREEVVGTIKREIPAPSYELLGMDSRGFFFFLLPVEYNRYELLILAESGNVKARCNINLEDSEIFIRILNISEEGILVGLLAFDEEVKIVWWRSDKLIGDLS
jgi:hypothetical protein